MLGTGSHGEVGWLAIGCLPREGYIKAGLGVSLKRTAVTRRAGISGVFSSHCMTLGETTFPGNSA